MYIFIYMYICVYIVIETKCDDLAKNNRRARVQAPGTWKISTDVWKYNRREIEEGGSFVCAIVEFVNPVYQGSRTV